MIYLSYLGYDNINNMSFEELQKEIINGNTCEIWYWALKYNRLDIIKSMYTNVTLSDGIMDIVAEYGHIDMLVWLHNNIKDCFSTKAIHLAAAKGHLEVVQFLYNNLAFYSTIDLEKDLNNAINDAAKNGHLEVIKWLYYNTDVNVSDPLNIQNAYFFQQKHVLNWLEDEVCLR